MASRAHALAGAMVLALTIDPVVARADAVSAPEPARQTARRLKHAGRALTAVGAAEIAAAVPLLAAGLVTAACQGDTCTGAPWFYYVPALKMLAAGGALTVVGLSLWIVAYASEHEARHLETAPPTYSGPPPPQ
jgi:hypothetical protein